MERPGGSRDVPDGGPGDPGADRALEHVPTAGAGAEPEEMETERIPRGGTGPSGAPAAPPGSARRRTAFAVAIAADLLQWVLVPLFTAVAVSPFDDVLDVMVAVVMVRLLGWHWAFLPAFVAELVPFVDLVPAWTLAVWVATRGRRA
jgi:hypothetical protein